MENPATALKELLVYWNHTQNPLNSPTPPDGELLQRLVPLPPGELPENMHFVFAFCLYAGKTLEALDEANDDVSVEAIHDLIDEHLPALLTNQTFMFKRVVLRDLDRVRERLESVFTESPLISELDCVRIRAVFEQLVSDSGLIPEAFSYHHDLLRDFAERGLNYLDRGKWSELRSVVFGILGLLTMLLIAMRDARVSSETVSRVQGLWSRVIASAGRWVSGFSSSAAAQIFSGVVVPQLGQ